MSGEGLRDRVACLRRVVESENSLTAVGFQKGKDAAFCVLEEIEKANALPASAREMVSQLRRSLTDFYNILFNRSWTRRFVLEDLDELERHCVVAAHERKAEQSRGNNLKAY